MWILGLTGLRELGSMSSFQTEVFKYSLALDKKQHICTAKYYFFLFFGIYIYIFYFCVRLLLILQIFSIHNSFICFLITVADHQSIPAGPLCSADRFSIILLLL